MNDNGIKLVRPSDKSERQAFKTEYYVRCNRETIGEIYMAKYKGYMLVGWFEIYSEFSKKGYGEKVIEHIFQKYDVKGIVCEVINTREAKDFWNHCLEKYGGKKSDMVVYCSTCCSMIIFSPGKKERVSEDRLEDMLLKCYEV